MQRALESFEELKALLNEIVKKCAVREYPSAKAILNHPEKYHFYHEIKLGDYNVGRSSLDDLTLTLPFYRDSLIFLWYSVSWRFVRFYHCAKDRLGAIKEMTF